MDSWNPTITDPQPNRAIDRAIRTEVVVKAGDRVVLRPLGRADAFDILLAGKLATVVSIEQDFEDRTYVAVTIDEDPGHDFGRDGQPGHRFFFGVEEVERIVQERA